MDHLFNHPAVLSGFAVVIVLMLLLDLGIFNKQSHKISNKEAAYWSFAWIVLSMLFSLVIYFVMDRPNGNFETFSMYQAAYWIEKSLSVDNLFVFILVFKFFKIPSAYQHKILSWGILGAIVFRAIFIFLGIGLIRHTYINAPFLGIDEATHSYRQINIVMTVFGIFLLYAGIKSWFDKGDEGEKDLSNNIAIKLIHKVYKVSDDLDKDKFFTVQNGIKMATPMLVCVAVIELTDLAFAVDSIPAIFAIAPDDPFILYTSNIFAILGLRSLYFLLANSMDLFSKLHYGLAVILSFIGLKMLIAPFYHIESLDSLMFIGFVLFVSISASLLLAKREVKT
ncbi:MAG: hypothetical protein M9887_05410 [Chitinophagales bacterium]|nr:hypothetical protein [Chitinophagales bacterium]